MSSEAAPSAFHMYEGPFATASDQMFYIMALLQHLRAVCLTFLARDHNGELEAQHQGMLRFIRCIVTGFPISFEDITGSIRRIWKNTNEHEELHKPLPYVRGFNLVRVHPSGSEPAPQQSANPSPLVPTDATLQNPANPSPPVSIPQNPTNTPPSASTNPFPAPTPTLPLPPSTPATDKTKAVDPPATTVPLSSSPPVPRGDEGKTKAAHARRAVPLPSPSPRPGPRHGRESSAYKLALSDSKPSLSDPKPNSYDSKPTPSDSKPGLSDSKPNASDSKPNWYDSMPPPSFVPRRSDASSSSKRPRGADDSAVVLHSKRPRSSDGSSTSSAVAGPSRNPPPDDAKPSSGSPLRRGKPLRRQGAFLERSHPHIFWDREWDSNPQPGDPIITPTQIQDLEEQTHVGRTLATASAARFVEPREPVVPPRAPVVPLSTASDAVPSTAASLARASLMLPPPVPASALAVVERTMSLPPSTSTFDSQPPTSIDAPEDDDDIYCTQEETDARNAAVAFLEASLLFPSQSFSAAVEEEDSNADQDSGSTASAAGASFPAFSPGNVPADIVAGILSTTPPGCSLPSPGPSPSPPPSQRPTRQSSPSVASSSSSEGSRGTKRSRGDEREENADDAEEERVTQRPRRNASEGPVLEGPTSTPSRRSGRLSGVKNAVAETVKKAFKKRRS